MQAVNFSESSLRQDWNDIPKQRPIRTVRRFGRKVVARQIRSIRNGPRIRCQGRLHPVECPGSVQSRAIEPRWESRWCGSTIGGFHETHSLRLTQLMSRYRATTRQLRPGAHDRDVPATDCFQRRGGNGKDDRTAEGASETRIPGGGLRRSPVHLAELSYSRCSRSGLEVALAGSPTGSSPGGPSTNRSVPPRFKERTSCS